MKKSIILLAFVLGAFTANAQSLLLLIALSLRVCVPVLE